VTRNPERPARRRAERHGKRAERVAAWWLRAKGYRILEHRYKSPVGEIDLVARRGRHIAFVEVKARRSRDQALESLSAHQRRRIIHAAEAWLAGESIRARLPDSYDISFDMVLVVPGRFPYHLSGLFDAS
jgi:putative endonuclease